MPLDRQRLDLTTSVAIGLQGTQSETSAGRGLARYVGDSVMALVERSPQTIAKLCLDPDLPYPGFIAEIESSVPRGAVFDSPEKLDGLVYHAPSPFEILPLESIWPVWARNPNVALVVTVHDLIPFLYPERYLVVDNVRRWQLPRLGILSVADALIAISQTTATDVVERLGVDPARIFITHEGCSSLFKPATVPVSDLFSRLKSGVPLLERGFILYVGGLDWRKNVEGLLAGYAGMDAATRAAHQLVIAGKVHPGETEPLIRLARRLGIPEQVIFTGYITDEQLVMLYQTCALFVFPSFYEGFGLPALEAMRCGAPVLVSDTSSLRELVPDPDGRFDPQSAPDIARKIKRALNDDAFRLRLLEMGAAEEGRFTWDRAVDEALRAYEYARRRRARLSSQ